MIERVYEIESVSMCRCVCLWKERERACVCVWKEREMVCVCVKIESLCLCERESEI